VINPDTGKPVLTPEDQLRAPDFNKAKHAEVVIPDPEAPEKSRRTAYEASEANFLPSTRKAGNPAWEYSSTPSRLSATLRKSAAVIG
jgi:hypothetical protein